MPGFPDKKKPLYAKVGDTLLFYCGDGEVRPLLVTHTDGKRVSGRVLLGRTETDRKLPAISKAVFMVPHDAISIYVEDVERGRTPGCWDYK